VLSSAHRKRLADYAHQRFVQRMQNAINVHDQPKGRYSPPCEKNGTLLIQWSDLSSEMKRFIPGRDGAVIVMLNKRQNSR
jgi:hypothetical protein